MSPSREQLRIVRKAEKKRIKEQIETRGFRRSQRRKAHRFELEVQEHTEQYKLLLIEQERILNEAKELLCQDN